MINQNHGCKQMVTLTLWTKLFQEKHHSATENQGHGGTKKQQGIVPGILPENLPGILPGNLPGILPYEFAGFCHQYFAAYFVKVLAIFAG